MGGCITRCSPSASRSAAAVWKPAFGMRLFRFWAGRRQTTRPRSYLLKADELRRLAALDRRKDAAHPKMPAIWTPGYARSTLATTAERLNALYARVEVQGGCPAQ